MADLPERLAPKSQKIAARVVDGEALIINLANGVYYSMNKVGGLIWTLIEQARSLDFIAEAVAASHDVPAAQARKDVEALAAQLIAEDLVAACDGLKAKAADPEAPAHKQPYEAPVLNIYDDMEELFALDPPMPGLQEMPQED